MAVFSAPCLLCILYSSSLEQLGLSGTKCAKAMCSMLPPCEIRHVLELPAASPTVTMGCLSGRRAGSASPSLSEMAHGRVLAFFFDESLGDDGELDGLQFTIYLTVSVCLVLMAGMMSGLTLGLMSLDTVELEVLKRSGTPDEKRCAAIIAPVVANQHLLLVTLLLCNALATEALPLFIDRLADPFTAVLVSVSVVLVFGEILPQAICSRYGLKVSGEAAGRGWAARMQQGAAAEQSGHDHPVGAYSAWFVRALMCLCSPLAWPVAKLLDYLLGADHSALFRRAQLKALVDVHSSTAGFGGTLSDQEIAVIRGALDLTSKTAVKSMTPLEKVFMLSTADRLDERTMQAILLSGHSRIPVYRDGNRYDMLKLFESGRSHMALLMGHSKAAQAAREMGAPHRPGRQSMERKPKGRPHQASLKRLGSSGTSTSTLAHHRPGYDEEALTGARLLDGPIPEDGESEGEGQGAGEEGDPVGIITIEDVIEELLQEEIIDETDLYVDNLQATRVNAAEVVGALPPRLQRMLNTGLFTPRVGRLATNRCAMPPALLNTPSHSTAAGVQVEPGHGLQRGDGAVSLVPLGKLTDSSL
ncbi:CNNM transmembrane domain-containing protein, partial [Haematococcus lacustris]